MATARRVIDSRYLFKDVTIRPSTLPFEQCVVLSSQLSKLPMLGREEPWEVIRMVPADVVPLLLASKIDFMLVGAHGASGWMMEPRATQDVDILVRPRDKTKATQAILSKFPDLSVEKHPDVWRFGKEGQVLLDLMLSNAAFLKRVLKEFEYIRIQGHRVKVPKVECALAMKFAAMTGFYRKQAKKYLDASDFMSMVEKNSVLNLGLLIELGELRYSGGGAELVKYVEDARAGKRMEI